MCLPENHCMGTAFVCRFAFEGTIQAIYGYDRDPLDCEHETVEDLQKRMQMCVFQEPTQMIKELDVEDAKFYVDLIVMCAFFVILRVACYLVLRWRARVH